MKNVRITFSMISRPSGGYKFQRHNAVIELPDEVADELEERQWKSRYVSDQAHNNPARHHITELLQIIAEVRGYQEGVFEFAEIVGDSGDNAE